MVKISYGDLERHPVTVEYGEARLGRSSAPTGRSGSTKIPAGGRTRRP